VQHRFINAVVSALSPNSPQPPGSRPTRTPVQAYVPCCTTRITAAEWSASLGVPALAGRVLTEFADVLATRDGRLSRLLLCANVARAHEQTGRATALTAPMAQAAASLLRDLA
jgi:hypothetical protein